MTDWVLLVIVAGILGGFVQDAAAQPPAPVAVEARQ